MKITKSRLRQIIKEEVENSIRNLSEEKVYSEIEGVFLTTTKAFLTAVSDMVSIAQETGSLEEALKQIEGNVDVGAYTAGDLHKALHSGMLITGGVYATSRDSFLKAMTDAGEAAIAGIPSDEVVSKIEANVDAGKYSDPRVRAVLKNLVSTGQPFKVGR